MDYEAGSRNNFDLRGRRRVHAVLRNYMSLNGLDDDRWQRLAECGGHILRPVLQRAGGCDEVLALPAVELAVSADVAGERRCDCGGGGGRDRASRALTISPKTLALPRGSGVRADLSAMSRLVESRPCGYAERDVLADARDEEVASRIRFGAVSQLTIRIRIRAWPRTEPAQCRPEGDRPAGTLRIDSVSEVRDNVAK